MPTSSDIGRTRSPRIPKKRGQGALGGILSFLAYTLATILLALLISWPLWTLAVNASGLFAVLSGSLLLVLVAFLALRRFRPARRSRRQAAHEGKEAGQ